MITVDQISRKRAADTRLTIEGKTLSQFRDKSPSPFPAEGGTGCQIRTRVFSSGRARKIKALANLGTDFTLHKRPSPNGSGCPGVGFSAGPTPGPWSVPAKDGPAMSEERIWLLGEPSKMCTDRVTKKCADPEKNHQIEVGAPRFCPLG
jgi:hypothetical protein